MLSWYTHNYLLSLSTLLCVELECLHNRAGVVYTFDTCMHADVVIVCVQICSCKDYTIAPSNYRMPKLIYAISLLFCSPVVL